MLSKYVLYNFNPFILHESQWNAAKEGCNSTVIQKVAMLFAVTPEVLLWISAFWGEEDLFIKKSVCIYNTWAGERSNGKGKFFLLGLICIRYR